MNKIPKVDIAIAAYNAEMNIENLLSSITEQVEKNFKINKIIVNSDVSIDKTVINAKKVNDKRIKILESKKRHGFAGSIIYLIKLTKSDILIVLNDDIVIKDKFFLSKAINPMLKDDSIGLVCCNPNPFQPINFISHAIYSGYMPYKKMFERIEKGNNVFSVDGKALCMSRKFLNNFSFPRDLRKMGNVDKFIYFSCKKNKFSYKYSADAKFYFKFPTSTSDFIKWQTRNFVSNKFLVRNTWGNILESEYTIPKLIFNYYKLVELLKNPLGSLYIYLLGIYCYLRARKHSQNFDIKWETVKTTKNI